MKHLAGSLILLAFAAAAPLNAQAPMPLHASPAPPAQATAPGQIRGVVVDAESNAPIPAASVAVWSKADDKLVAGAIVREDGSFKIEGLRPGSYVVKLVMIGYTTQTTAIIAISNETPSANLGSIKLTRAAVEVAGVEVNAQRVVTIQPDRNTYRAKEVSPAATSASEILENVPAVSVDADGKVSLRGNENVVVQINGRPTPISGTQLASYLKQLPANTVEHVEVIPNPSATQDPEGMAGIINIVMKQGVDLGTSGGINLMESTASRYSAGANIGHQAGALAYFLSYGFNNDARDEVGVNNRTRFASSGDPLSFTLQDVDGNNYNRGHNLSANADYTFNKQNVLSTSLQLNRRTGGQGSTILFNELTGEGVSTSQYNRLRDQNSRNWMGDGALSFKHTIKPQQNEWSAEARFNHQDDRDLTNLWSEPLGLLTRSDLENDDSNAQTDNLTAQFDLTRMLNKTTKLETGVKHSDRWLDRDYEVTKDATGSGVWTPSDLSNVMAFSEDVNAAYAVFSQSHKKFDLQGGLRGEYAQRDFKLTETNEDYPHNYASLFPSALVNYKINDKSQAKLSYSRRIRRPGTQELNPFPVFFDAQNVFLGNPQLDPEYTDAIELGYQRSGSFGSLQIAPFFRRTNNVISVDIDPNDSIAGRAVTTISFKNLDHNTSWGTDVNGQFRLSKTISGLAGFNIFKQVTDGGSESALSNNGVTWMARLNTTFALLPTTSVIVNYMYRAGMNMPKSHFSGMQMTNIAVRQKLRGDKAVAIVRFADPFNTMRFKVDVNSDNVEQFTTRHFNSRAAFISLQYNFGKPPKLRQRKQDDQPQSTNPFGS